MPRVVRCLILSVFAVFAAVLPASAQQTVPIAQATSEDGMFRYWVPIYIGSSEMIRAQLDTGSTGLKIMTKATDHSNYKPTGDTVSEKFANGVVMGGTVAYAKVRIGDGAATHTEIPFEIVTSARCSDERPKCPARDISLDDGYLVGGDGIAREGFQAVLGIGMRGVPQLVNPLTEVDGNHRWIVQLPMPSRDQVFGTLMVNPPDRLYKDYWLMKLKPQGQAKDHAWIDDRLSGCIVDHNGDRKTCMDTILDTGAGAIKLHLKDIDKPTTWPYGPGAMVTVTGDAPVGEPATLNFSSDNTSHGTLEAVPADKDQLDLGVYPYYVFSVLYDYGEGTIGLGPKL